MVQNFDGWLGVVSCRPKLSNKIKRLGGAPRSREIFCKSLKSLDFFWMILRSEFGQPVALLRFSRPLPFLRHALLRKLYYYNTTFCAKCQPESREIFFIILAFFGCNVQNVVL